MAIRTNYDLSADERTAHEAIFGGFNAFPPGWRELTQADFAKSAYFTYSPELVEYRQMYDSGGLRVGGQPAVSAHLNFLHDNTGFAIVNDFWKGTVKFFAFGCDHEFVDGSAEAERRQIRRFYPDNARYCPKCNYLAIHDTSD